MNLDIEYRIWDEASRTTTSVRESADCSGLTDIVQTETDGRVFRIAIPDSLVPLLIKALQRRLDDAKDGEP